MPDVPSWQANDGRHDDGFGTELLGAMMRYEFEAGTASSVDATGFAKGVEGEWSESFGDIGPELRAVPSFPQS